MPKNQARRPARPRFLLGPGQRLIAVFVVFILLPGAFLGLFALRALRQEGRLAEQRTRERLERIVGEIVADLDSNFRQWEETLRLADKEGPFDSGSYPDIIRQALEQPGCGVLLFESQRGLQTFPHEALLYQLADAPAPQGIPSRFPPSLAEAESLEIGRKDYERAIRAYRRLLDSSDTKLRPLILQRLARTLRKVGRLEEAATAYRDLQRLDTAWIGGLPSDLIARSELCSLAAERGDNAQLQAYALAFYRDLSGGKWLLDKPRYLYYSKRCRSWCLEGQAAEAEFNDLRMTEERKLALTRAAGKLLNEPKRVLSGEAGVHLAFWQTDPLAAVVLSAGFLGSNWWPQVLSAKGEDIDAALFSPDGQALFGSSPAETQPFAVTRELRAGEAPWRLQIWPRRPAVINAEIRQRQTLSLTMLVFVGALLLFGGYITIRIMRREMEIARLRADFVSTVSHEFRSPLTGIRHLAEMLLEGRVTAPEKQRGYFRMIVQESDRLARLIENILDFSRMEEGRREYRFEPLNPTPWLRKLAADFGSEIAASGVVVEANIPDGLPSISADSQALGSAVRNLLDNAVKYSPGEKTVWLDAKAEDAAIRIAVRDRGVGISEQDQKHIFDRFYRAEGDISKKVKGAGLGLSLVQHIVAAHDGTVECRSRIGEGSIFTIRLPFAPITGGG
ncbi:MAG: HAMP domain-containing sensor histidine kinase [Candidatus Aminicenantales bacterium]